MTKHPHYPDLSGKVIVVTGAAQGQGAAEVAYRAANGCQVVAVDVAPFDAPSPSVEVRVVDVSLQADWMTLADDLAQRYGRVDGLVNNAGITWRARIDAIEADDMARVFAVNTIGPTLGIRHLSTHMPPGSSIVNVGSAASVTAHYAIAYTASKWALSGVTRTAAMSLGPLGIRVNQVNPGFIETPMTLSASDAFRDINIALAPLGRTGTVDDVVPIVGFLLSGSSSYITGAEIPVDGGLTSHGGAKVISDALG